MYDDWSLTDHHAAIWRIDLKQIFDGKN